MAVVFGDPRTRTIDTRAYVDLKYDHTFANDWQVLSRLSYDHYPYNGYYFYNVANPDEPLAIVENRDRGRSDWWGAELQVSKKLFDRHKVILGAEYRDYFRLNQSNFDVEPFAPILDDKRDSKVWAFYAQDEITILQNLRLNAGLRYDHYSTFGGSLNPRVALIYNPFELTAIKLLYGQAFRAPNVYELFYQDDGATQKASPGLKPEKISTYEVVWEQYFAKNYRFTASGYYYKIDDLISQQVDPADGLIVFLNTDRVEAKGTRHRGRQYAGDIHTDSCSSYARGVDCSGFVCGAGRRRSTTSTYMMDDPAYGPVSLPYTSWEDLQVGDAEVRKPGHVRMANGTLPGGEVLGTCESAAGGLLRGGGGLPGRYSYSD